MDVYVIYHVLCVDIYVISLFVLMESKKPKNSIFPLFAEYHTRQRTVTMALGKAGKQRPNFPASLSARAMTLGKYFFFKKKKKFLCRVQEYGTRQRIFKKKILCRVSLRWHSTKRPSELTSDFFFAEC